MLLAKKKIEISDILYRKNIVYFNDTRKTINELCMNEMIKGLTRYVVLDVPDNCNNDKSQLTYIYKGLPVMVIANNKEMEIINSDEYIVYEVNPSSNNMLLYSNENIEETLVVEFKDFHKNFVANYAATTHKSQGATISKDINIFDWDRLQKDKRVGYTAISRAKKPSQLTIVSNYREFRFRNNADEVWYDDNDEPIIDDNFEF